MNLTGGPTPTPVPGKEPTHRTGHHSATTSADRRHCALLSRGLDEPLPATAPPGTGSWLAVEHRGPWPTRPTDACLPAPASAVLRAAEALGIRTQLIRRPDRRRPATTWHTVLVAAHVHGQPWLERANLPDLAALRGLDLATLAQGHAPGFGTPTARPQVLVCTHGRHDACCAQLGRPTAVAAATAHPGRVWETTHLGGDRFAGNLACLPHGTYHGRVTATTAATVTAACLAGRVHLPHYRGRAGLPGPAQAAEHAVRVATGLTHVDAVAVEGVEQVATMALVRLRAGGRRLAVPVRTVSTGPPRPTACAGCTLDTPTSYVTGTPYPLPR